MGADATLVQGAYDANKYTKQGVDAATRRLGDSLSDTVGKLKARKDAEAVEDLEEATTEVEVDEVEEAVKVQDAETDENAELAIDKPGLNHKEDQQLIGDQAESWRRDYINATPAEQKDLMKQLDDTAKTAGKFVNLKQEFAEDWTARNVEGGKSGVGMSASITTTDKDFVNKLLSPENSDLIENRTKDKDGKVTVEYGIEGPDGKFMSSTQAETYLKSLQVDVVSTTAIGDIRLAQKAGMVTSNPETGFDREEVGRQVKDIVNNSTKRSMMYDNQFGDTSFIEDLKAGMLAKPVTYAQLGLSEYDAKKYDNNLDGEFDSKDNLSKEDMKALMDRFETSDDTAELRTNMLEDYLTNHIERQWSKAYKDKYGKDFGIPVSNEVEGPNQDFNI